MVAEEKRRGHENGRERRVGWSRLLRAEASLVDAAVFTFVWEWVHMCRFAERWDVKPRVVRRRMLFLRMAAKPVPFVQSTPLSSLRFSRTI